MSPHVCPFCGKECVSKPGKLDQTGETYLPTTLWSCTGMCDYKRWDSYTPTKDGRSWRYKHEAP